MNLKQFEERFATLGNSYKTKDKDRLNKTLIKENVDVSFLKDIIMEKQKYHRSYFQISLGTLKDVDKQFKFIEDNFDKLNDWWHVDQLQQFISKKTTFDFAINKAKEYINHPNLFARRWGYVLFMPTLVKDKQRYKEIFDLFKDDNEYYVIMAEAWLLSYLAIYYPIDTLTYLKGKPLSYSIVGKAIQKTCDSFRVSKEIKEKFKEIRNEYK